MGSNTSRRAKQQSQSNAKPKRQSHTHYEKEPIVQEEPRLIRTKAQAFKPLTKAQKTYMQKIDANTVTFAEGPAGTGKSYVAAYKAWEMYTNKDVDRIIIVHPAVESGKSLGFLKGELADKYGPFVAPFMEALAKMFGKGQVEAMLEYEKIVFLPLAYARGWTFERAFVVFEEAQNATQTEMKLFLTRIGAESKIVIDGDRDQRDNGECGFQDAIWRLQGVPSIATQRFTVEDVVRHGLVKSVLERYDASYTPEKGDNEENREGLNTFLAA